MTPLLIPNPDRVAVFLLSGGAYRFRVNYDKSITAVNTLTRSVTPGHTRARRALIVRTIRNAIPLCSEVS
jgi:hypothetical protein